MRQKHLFLLRSKFPEAGAFLLLLFPVEFLAPKTVPDT